ncbi:nudix family protein [Halogeometricum borinquense DSM 11551]|uniref:Nudix family protein n=1 Tax=Halogeometricum borinquense (strain ATCC 700274 / DSM 11551 / JCM 10706 / KCTC 4070 / PR3) TaxID=469382 RepID=E4NMP2_HALBP|nr:NUDIX hydrolase [Halogeometricum borinquense]ADQ66197.1 NUDIX family protein [Halogeometricum borinquense DSM 11551]ELY27308.1 nudix family protein [Halogeometricum borinquense DSM 11551]
MVDDDDTAQADELAWETTASAVEYTCPGFDVQMDDVVLPDGTETEFHYVDEPEAVVVLPFTPDDDVVLVEEWRQAVGRVNRGLPAGSLESDDDDIAAAARRELTEETGYEAGSLEYVGSVEPANGLLNSVHHHFVARDCEPTGEQELDFNESIRVAVEPYDDVLTAALDGEMRDGRALHGVLRYELAERWR